jgi:hypothetical protein
VRKDRCAVVVVTPGSVASPVAMWERRLVSARTGAIRGVLLGCVMALLVATGARADIFAAVEVASPDDTNSDVAVMNAVTGARVTLPPGTNTSGNELHPSISSDGKRLVFQRLLSGTNRIIAEDLSAGTSADLFDVFASQQLNPQTPFILSDGSRVLAGEPVLRDSSGSGPPTAALLSVPMANFPGGPFPSSQLSFAVSPPADRNQLWTPVQRGSAIAAGLSDSLEELQILLHTPASDLLFPAGTNTLNAHPALDPTAGIVAFEHATNLSQPFQLQYRSSDPAQATAPTTSLPALVNAPGNFYETHPAFTPDDRYLGFVRFDARSDVLHDRLFVFDTQTQTLLNPTGIDLGRFETFDLGFGFTVLMRGGLSLRESPVFSSAILSNIGRLNVGVLQPTGVGLLVQRIVGRHKLLGKTVPRLRTVGRVPLGFHRRGHFRVRWNHRVAGRRLAPGRYLVTVRAVTRRGKVTQLGRSFRVRIR